MIGSLGNESQLGKFGNFEIRGTQFFKIYNFNGITFLVYLENWYKMLFCLRTEIMVTAILSMTVAVTVTMVVQVIVEIGVTMSKIL